MTNRIINPDKNSYELSAWQDNRVVCGVDEVGRGCLAGPLITAAVILHPGANSPQLKDSKVLTPEKLALAADWIVQHSWYGYGIVDQSVIDSCNIYQATLIAMKRAVVQAIAGCPLRPNAILVDAMPLKLASTGFEDIPVHHFPKAESLSCSVAAASILAKVKRDALMQRLDGVISGYGFAAHKGYATDVHCTALRAQGKSILHRNSFLGFLEQHDAQQTIC